MSELRKIAKVEKALLRTGLSIVAIGSFPVAAVAKSSTRPKEGYDITYENKDNLPNPGAFAIVGLNGDNAVEYNPYFKNQLAWAKKSKGGSSQPKAAIYVHTDNPGSYKPKVADWPKNGKNTDGTCNGNNTPACEYQYGENLAQKDIAHEGNVGVKTVWLDVEGTEDGYTWEPNNKSGNATVLEGMTYSFEKDGYKVGIYSGEGDWNNTIGSTSKHSDISNLPVWILGATTESGAEANCHGQSFSGHIVLAQIAGSTLDRDIVC